ncbi:hypothetical protein E3N88_16675 [Mikania micrantha]|uniref:Retrotransposon gag domain-containing protein n=1 Tax=Mikania micrantha TaxID=192012 RepID=A0A5N6P259_9ASTR|nr:hypothetical protein E3N88_16675 [Mikania micrantha]
MAQSYVLHPLSWLLVTNPNPIPTLIILHGSLMMPISDACLSPLFLRPLSSMFKETSHDIWLALENAYAPTSFSRVSTIKTQLLRISMQGDETSTAYLNRAQSLAISLANIKQAIPESDLVMLVISGLREEYNGLKSTPLIRQTPTPFANLYGLLEDHDFMIK